MTGRNGRVLLTKKFINRLTWANGIASDGRPQVLPESGVTSPEDATNWNATTFSPATRLYYVVAVKKCAVKLSPGNLKSDLPEEPAKKYLRALSIETGDVAWEVPQVGEADGRRMASLLATAGGLAFFGNPSGDFVAMDERDGNILWHLPTSGINKASPMTCAVNGRQFVAVAIGPNIMCFGLPE